MAILIYLELTFYVFNIYKQFQSFYNYPSN